jgi:hypothetical protein
MKGMTTVVFAPFEVVESCYRDVEFIENNFGSNRVL